MQVLVISIRIKKRTTKGIEICLCMFFGVVLVKHCLSVSFPDGGILTRTT